MVTSTGTFVSCKDYDDDIDNLQGQIDKLVTPETLSAQIAQLQANIDAANRVQVLSWRRLKLLWKLR